MPTLGLRSSLLNKYRGGLTGESFEFWRPGVAWMEAYYYL